MAQDKIYLVVQDVAALMGTDTYLGVFLTREDAETAAAFDPEKVPPQYARAVNEVANLVQTYGVTDWSEIEPEMTDRFIDDPELAPLAADAEFLDFLDHLDWDDMSSAFVIEWPVGKLRMLIGQGSVMR